MTAERIMKEIEARIAILEPKIREIDHEVSVLYHGMTDDKFYKMKSNHPIRVKDRKLSGQRTKIKAELSKLHDMQYAYEQNPHI